MFRLITYYTRQNRKYLSVILTLDIDRHNTDSSQDNQIWSLKLMRSFIINSNQK